MIPGRPMGHDVERFDRGCLTEFITIATINRADFRRVWRKKCYILVSVKSN